MAKSLQLLGPHEAYGPLLRGGIVFAPRPGGEEEVLLVLARLRRGAPPQQPRAPGGAGPEGKQSAQTAA